MQRTRKTLHKWGVFFKIEKKTPNGNTYILCHNFEPIEFQTCSAPSDRLKFSFVKDIHVVGEKKARNGRKTAIYQ